MKKKMNLNQMAKEICRREGKNIQVNIAQVKEILKITLEILEENKKEEQREKANAKCLCSA